jgi:parvulin-like peptidyl-prolyl isomerase
MKKIIYLSFFTAVLASSCANKAKETDAAPAITTTETKDANTTTTVSAVVSQKTKDDVKAKLEGIRAKVISKEMTIGEAAQQYSDDPGSNKNGGRYNNIARGQFVPEFEKVAFALQPGQISEVFETQYGFHFVQLIAKHNDLIDVSHVLIIPK